MYLKVYLLIYYTILPHLNTLPVYLMDTYLIRLKQIIQPAFYIGNYLIQLLRFVYIKRIYFTISPAGSLLK